MTSLPVIYALSDAAELLGVSSEWLRSKLRDHTFAGVKIAGRWNMTEQQIELAIVAMSTGAQTDTAAIPGRAAGPVTPTQTRGKKASMTTTPDQAEVISDAINAVADRLTTEVVGHTDDFNGGRLSGSRAQGLAHLAVCTLLTQGWAVVRLPEAQPSGIRDQVEWPVTRDAIPADAAVVIRHDGKIGNDGIDNPYCSPHDARSHAAALLAAANEVLGHSFEVAR